MSARFDDRDRLVRAHTPDDRLVRHRDDALGRRVETVAERPDGPVTGVPSPHVEPFVEHTAPNGRTFVNTAPDRTRPARPEEYSGLRNDL